MTVKMKDTSLEVLRYGLKNKTGNDEELSNHRHRRRLYIKITPSRRRSIIEVL